MSIINFSTNILTRFKCFGKIVSNGPRQNVLTRIFNNSNAFQKLQLYPDKRYCQSMFSNRMYHTYRINYLQQFVNTIDIARLKWRHDPDFNIESFGIGARQVSTSSTNRLVNLRCITYQGRALTC